MLFHVRGTSAERQLLRARGQLVRANGRGQFSKQRLSAEAGGSGRQRRQRRVQEARFEGESQTAQRVLSAIRAREQRFALPGWFIVPKSVR